MKALIGHRGSGKSDLSKRMLNYLPALKVFDLDLEISKRVNSPVKDYIEKEGIRAFRQKEIDVFNEIYKEHGQDPDAVAVVGAGFEGTIPPDVEVLWVRRLTDAKGRAFLNRPRLGKNYRASQDFLDSFPLRQMRFKARAHGNELVLKEGLYTKNSVEQKYFQSQLKFKNKLLTLLPEHFNNPRLKDWIEERLSWGLFLEFRSDLLSEAQWNMVSEWIPQDYLLYSMRKSRNYESASSSAFWIDVEIEDLPNVHHLMQPKILSAHRRKKGEALELFFSRLEAKGEGLLLKASPEIYNFAELKIGHEWFLKNKYRHVFLPRTPEGEEGASWWRWYRLVMANRQSFAFVREGEGSSLDQPTLLELASLPKGFEGFEHFAAIIGDSVGHSFSPQYHEEFFAKLTMPFLGVSVARSEDFSEVMNFLDELGLRAAAITSPYKKIAYDFTHSNHKGPDGFANTLVKKSSGEWLCAWTDPEGIEALASEVPTGASVAIWGSGSMSQLLQRYYPQASVFSARSGERLKGKGSHYDVLFWAAGNHTDTWPEFQVKKVIDLDYTSFSKGLDFAVSHRLPYVSGLEMFTAQAKLQQDFWKSHLKTNAVAADLSP